MEGSAPISLAKLAREVLPQLVAEPPVRGDAGVVARTCGLQRPPRTGDLRVRCGEEDLVAAAVSRSTRRWWQGCAPVCSGGLAYEVGPIGFSLTRARNAWAPSKLERPPRTRSIPIGETRKRLGCCGSGSCLEARAFNEAEHAARDSGQLVTIHDCLMRVAETHRGSARVSPLSDIRRHPGI